MTMTHSALLRAKIELAQPRVQGVAQRFWRHDNVEEVFKRHLQNLYFTVSSSRPLLQHALARSRELPEDAVASALIPYLEEHIEEEDGHDEWVLDDLEVLGVSRETARSRMPPPAVASLTGSQHYYIDTVHPVALTAYQAVVEGNPPRVDFLEGIVARTRIPKAALGSFYKHAEIDKHHGKALWAMLDALPLGERHVALLGMNAMLCCDLIAGLMESTLDALDSEH
jgi:hypothetical protein